MRKSLALFVSVFVYLGALFAPAMGASLQRGPDRSPSSSTELSAKQGSKKTCKKLKKKIKKAKSKKAKKKAKKKYNKKCKCQKLKKKAKKAKSPKKRKNAQRKFAAKCTSGGGGTGGTGGGGSGGGGTTTKTERTVEGTYANPAAGLVGIGSDCTAGGCVEIATESTESYITVEITDASGLPVAAALAQDTDGDGVGTFFATVCGASAAATPITPGMPVTVIIGAGVVVDGATIPPGACPSAATSGTVKATLSNRP